MRAGWPRLIYALTGLTYLALPIAQYLLGKKLGCEVNLPDLDPFFTPQDFAAFKLCIIQTLPDATQGLGLFATLHGQGLDLVFPALFAFALILLTWRTAALIPRFASQNPILKLTLICTAPIAYALADYTENFTLLRWLGGSLLDDRLPLITSATTAKFAFVGIAAAILILFSLARLKQRKGK
jgi:amino acid transporter